LPPCPQLHSGPSVVPQFASRWSRGYEVKQCLGQHHHENWTLDFPHISHLHSLPNRGACQRSCMENVKMLPLSKRGLTRGLGSRFSFDLPKTCHTVLLVLPSLALTTANSGRIGLVACVAFARRPVRQLESHSDGGSDVKRIKSLGYRPCGPRHRCTNQLGCTVASNVKCAGPRVPCSAGPEDGTGGVRRDACASLYGPLDVQLAQ
jgi:hypothetical protein